GVGGPGAYRGGRRGGKYRLDHFFLLGNVGSVGPRGGAIRLRLHRDLRPREPLRGRVRTDHLARGGRSERRMGVDQRRGTRMVSTGVLDGSVKTDGPDRYNLTE